MRLKLIIITLLFSFISLQAQNPKTKLSYNDLALSGMNVLETNKTRTANSPTVFQFDKPKKKSVGKALLLSLILPGAGEFYVGNQKHATIFFGTELLAWTSFLINDYHANSLEKDYKAYAQQHAKINGSGHNEQYWVDVGKFNTIYDFNKRRENDRRVEAIYDESSANFWQWDSKKNRFTYDRNRLNAIDIKNRDVYFYTAILINHIVSGINAVRLARKNNKSLARNSFNYRFVVNTFQPHNNYVGIAMSQSF
jgi:hypothetical protein